MQFMETVSREVATWPYAEAVFVNDYEHDRLVGPFPTREQATAWADEFMAPNSNWTLEIAPNQVPFGSDETPNLIINPLAKFKALANQLQAIIDDPDLNWETKFDLGFKLRQPIESALDDRIEWYDPDTTYQEDILAFNAAVQERLNR